MKRSLALLAAFVIASGYQSLSGETSGDWTYTVTDNRKALELKGEQKGEGFSFGIASCFQCVG
jgi:VCBS repeat-containing protein